MSDNCDLSKRYTAEYMAQEYRNAADNARVKLEKLQKENEELKLKITQLEKEVFDLKTIYC
tara:strand:+ start:4856 stop:5038 length:183 start_codon:yes stop_codon:yes gene_type:complete